MNILNYLIHTAQADSGDMGYGSHMFSGWGGYLAVILLLIFLILIVIGAIYMIKSLNQNQAKNQGKSSREILEERYAKGEIDKEEFDKKKKDIV